MQRAVLQRGTLPSEWICASILDLPDIAPASVQAFKKPSSPSLPRTPLDPSFAKLHQRFDHGKTAIQKPSQNESKMSSS